MNHFIIATVQIQVVMAHLGKLISFFSPQCPPVHIVVVNMHEGHARYTHSACIWNVLVLLTVVWPPDAKSLAVTDFIVPKILTSVVNQRREPADLCDDCLLVDFNRVPSSSSASRMCCCCSKSVLGWELLLVGGFVVLYAGLELHSGWFV